mmetsp:Transcript_88541/g.271034  ORF Transcript_88541/g.271034 Transcript_88541/m.271034 type:complete len:227 (+) Transcript_88541:153-833(+)
MVPSNFAQAPSASMHPPKKPSSPVTSMLLTHTLFPRFAYSCIAPCENTSIAPSIIFHVFLMYTLSVGDNPCVWPRTRSGKKTVSASTLMVHDCFAHLPSWTMVSHARRKTRVFIHEPQNAHFELNAPMTVVGTGGSGLSVKTDQSLQRKMPILCAYSFLTSAASFPVLPATSQQNVPPVAEAPGTVWVEREGEKEDARDCQFGHFATFSHFDQTAVPKQCFPSENL